MHFTLENHFEKVYLDIYQMLDKEFESMSLGQYNRRRFIYFRDTFDTTANEIFNSFLRRYDNLSSEVQEKKNRYLLEIISQKNKKDSLIKNFTSYSVIEYLGHLKLSIHDLAYYKN
jgi:hypothetical protein